MCPSRRPARPAHGLCRPPAVAGGRAPPGSESGFPITERQRSEITCLPLWSCQNNVPVHYAGRRAGAFAWAVGFEPTYTGFGDRPPAVGAHPYRVDERREIPPERRSRPSGGPRGGFRARSDYTDASGGASPPSRATRRRPGSRPSDACQVASCAVIALLLVIGLVVCLLIF